MSIVESYVTRRVNELIHIYMNLDGYIEAGRRKGGGIVWKMMSKIGVSAEITAEGEMGE